MSIATVRAGLVAVANGLSIVVGSDTLTLNVLEREPDEVPATAQLPMMYPIASRAVYDFDQYGDDEIDITREYQLYMLFDPSGQKTQELKEQACDAIIESIVDRMSSYPSLGNVAGIQDTRVVSDSGPIPNLRENYWGAIITIRVQEIRSRSFGSNE